MVLTFVFKLEHNWVLFFLLEWGQSMYFRFLRLSDTSIFLDDKFHCHLCHMEIHSKTAFSIRSVIRLRFQGQQTWAAMVYRGLDWRNALLELTYSYGSDLGREGVTQCHWNTYYSVLAKDSAMLATSRYWTQSPVHANWTHSQQCIRAFGLPRLVCLFPLWTPSVSLYPAISWIHEANSESRRQTEVE